MKLAPACGVWTWTWTWPGLLATLLAGACVDGLNVGALPVPDETVDGGTAADAIPPSPDQAPGEELTDGAAVPELAADRPSPYGADAGATTGPADPTDGAGDGVTDGGSEGGPYGGADALAFSARPEKLDFGPVVFGSESHALSILLQNVSAQRVPAPTAIWPPGSEFEPAAAPVPTFVRAYQGARLCAATEPLDPGASCGLFVRFRPQSRLPPVRSAQLVLRADGWAETRVFLAGEVVPPDQITATEDVPSPTSQRLPFRVAYLIQNRSNRPTGSLTVRTEGAGFVIIESSCPLTLAGGGSCFVHVDYQKLSQTGYLIVRTDRGGYAEQTLMIPG